MRKNPLILLICSVVLLGMSVGSVLLTAKYYKETGDKAIRITKKAIDKAQKEYDTALSDKKKVESETKVVDKEVFDDYSDFGYDYSLLSTKLIKEKMIDVYTKKKTEGVSNLDKNELFNQANASFKVNDVAITVSKASKDGFEGLLIVKFYAYQTGSNASISDMTPSYDVYNFSTLDGKSYGFNYIGQKAS